MTKEAEAEQRRNQPLKVLIEREQLVIRIGVNTLKVAAENCPEFFRADHPQDPPFVKVLDELELAEDVLAQITGEEEDGATPLSTMFDKAIFEAFEQGSFAFEEDGDE